MPNPSEEAEALAETIRTHLENAKFIKGWEVDKRTCVGAKRQNLRKAARVAKARLTERSGGWEVSVSTLQRELAVAGEADFDGVLSEALEALHKTIGNTNKAESIADIVRATERHMKRGDLAKGKREYAEAEACAKHVRDLVTTYNEALKAAAHARQAYAAGADSLRKALEEIGEADFDGLLRQAVSMLKEADPLNSVQTRTDSKANMELVPATPLTAQVMDSAAKEADVRPSLQPPPPMPVTMPKSKAIELSAELSAEEVDGGCVWLGTLAPEVQGALLREVFAEGAVGVCGGLVEGRRVRGAHGKEYSPQGTTHTDWSGLGLHGSHTVPYDHTKHCTLAGVLAAVRAAAPSLPEATRAELAQLEPSVVRVAYETMAGRTIASKGSLCGWSSDRLRANAKDGSLKLVMLLGTASSVLEGYKYSRDDAEALTVPLKPGELLLLHGDARSWVSAVTGFTAGTPPSETCPFDFVHLTLMDLRSFARAKPAEYAKLLEPASPRPGDASYKWMQCGYTVTKAAAGDGELPSIELRGHKA